MIFYRMPSHDIRRNLATEEYLMDTIDVSKEPCLLFYIQEPCVIIGRNQDTEAEINSDYLKAHQIVLTRRTSGGGAVYDDLGNMSFSVVSKYGDQSFGDYRAFTRPIVQALEAMGAEGIEVHGRNDLHIDGKKFSGNAMYTQNGRIYSHGTLMYQVDIDALTQVLHVAQEKVDSKATKSIRTSVTNIQPYLDAPYQGLTTDAFRDQLICHIYGVEDISEMADKEYHLTSEDEAAIDKLFEERYANDEWIFGKWSDKQHKKRQRYTDVGIVEIHFSVVDDKLSDVHISGDFFGVEDIEGLESVLTGVRYETAALEDALETVDIDAYIQHLTASQLVDLLFSDDR